MTKKTDFCIGQIDTKLIPGHKGKQYYHPCLVYKPAELVLIQITIYSKEQDNKGTSLKTLKVLQRFCQWFQKQIHEKEDLVRHIARFERMVTINDIERWMADRDINRTGPSPSEAHIDADARQVCYFLDWAKERLEKRGVIVAFEGGSKLTRLIPLRETDMYKGVMGPRNVTTTRFGANLDSKPEPGENHKKMAKRTQSKCHEYLTDEELGIFFGSFYDPVFKFITLAGYHTGVRPHEVLAIPRFVMYGKGQFFTSEPRMLKERLEDGQKEITWHCMGKGQKTRPVKFNLIDWYRMMDMYEKTVFAERRRSWERLNGEELPPHVLWLARPWRSRGCPRIIQNVLGDQARYDRYTGTLWEAINGARDRGKLVERFSKNVDYYSLRHSFATNFLVRNIRGGQEARKKNGQDSRDTEAIIADLNLKERLRNQLGHERFETSFKHYIHNVDQGALELPSILNFCNEDGA